MPRSSKKPQASRKASSMVLCPQCGTLVAKLQKHLRKVHSVRVPTQCSKPVVLVVCPQCAKHILQNQLQGHIESEHRSKTPKGSSREVLHLPMRSQFETHRETDTALRRLVQTQNVAQGDHDHGQVDLQLPDDVLVTRGRDQYSVASARLRTERVRAAQKAYRAQKSAERETAAERNRKHQVEPKLISHEEYLSKRRKKVPRTGRPELANIKPLAKQAGIKAQLNSKRKSKKKTRKKTKRRSVWAVSGGAFESNRRRH